MSGTTAFRHWYVSDAVVDAAGLPSRLRDALGELPDVLHPEADHDLAVVLASELLKAGDEALPRWTGPATKYLVLLDIPEPAVLRLPTILSLHKPDQRLHVTRDGGAVERAVIGLHRPEAWKGVVDAYVCRGALVLVLADFSIRSFQRSRLPAVGHLDAEAFGRFAIDPAGSGLHWPELDVHLDVSRMLRAVDPGYAADLAIGRHTPERISRALREFRRERGLTQGDVPGISERQVRRLENGESRLTVDAAEKYAAAFELPFPELIRRLGRRMSRLEDEEPAPYLRLI